MVIDAAGKVQGQLDLPATRLTLLDFLGRMAEAHTAAKKKGKKQKRWF